MEAQLLSSQFLIQQNSQNLLINKNQFKSDHSDNEFQSSLLDLIRKGQPIFICQQKITIKNQHQNQKQIDKKQNDLNEKILTYDRKSKSLQHLSKKFIDHFEGRGNNIIQLDKITIQLGVQRRRIYDIIIILQSLGVVKKKGKNNYEWKGLQQAVRTIQICKKEGQAFKSQNQKKEKSLEYLASGFLKLFINWKPAISLHQAAKQMMKQMGQACIKTKIRRLYDIINVFRSLGLVRRSVLPSNKPGYQWAGTDNLECLILKKQENDQYTRVNEFNVFQDLPNVEQKNNSIFLTRNSFFSPLICPTVPKSEVDVSKQPVLAKFQPTFSLYNTSLINFNQQSSHKKGQLPIFWRSKSAFTLVNTGKNNQN